MPKQLIKGDAIIENTWQKITADDSIPDSGNILVSVERWQAERDALLARSGGLGLILEPGQEPNEFAEDLPHFQVVAIHFPVFRDGRGFSYGRELRTRLGYKGEIRAIGDVLQDQLFYLQRCGFDAFEMPATRDLEEALAGFKVFSLAYQGDVHDARPIWKR